MTAEKHLVYIKKDGFKLLQTFIDLSINDLFSFKLEKAAADKEDDGRSRVLCIPFINLGDPSDNNLAPVFSDSIAAGLHNENSLEVTVYPWNLVQKSSTVRDFIKLAENSGSRMLIMGNYRVADDEILVQASLIDVQTELVKTSLLFPGKAGIEVFDSIDTMTEEFLGNFSKVLPEVGKRVITRQISDRIPEIEKELSDLDWIASRNQRDIAVEAGVAYGGRVDEYEDLPFDYYAYRSSGTILALNLLLEKFFSNNISLVMKSTPMIILESNNIPGYYTIPIIIEPRLTFSSLKTDTYLGITGSLEYSSKVTVYDSNGLNPISRGPYFYFLAGVDTGIRIYTYKRKNDVSSFYSIGFSYSFAGTRTKYNFSESFPVDMDIWFTLSYGKRL